MEEICVCECIPAARIVEQFHDRGHSMRIVNAEVRTLPVTSTLKRCGHRQDQAELSNCLDECRCCGDKFPGRKVRARACS
jgi:hypothetical protein